MHRAYLQIWLSGYTVYELRSEPDINNTAKMLYRSTKTKRKETQNEMPEM